MVSPLCLPAEVVLLVMQFMGVGDVKNLRAADPRGAKPGLWMLLVRHKQEFKNDMLLRACKRGMGIVEELRSTGFDVNCRNSEVPHTMMRNRMLDREPRDATPLIIAAAFGHSGVVGILERTDCRFADAVDLDATDDAGDTALIWAARNGHATVAWYLLCGEWSGRRADADIVGRRGRTAVMEAVANGHMEVVELMYGMRVGKVDAVDGDGDTVVMMASRAGGGELMRVVVDWVGRDAGGEGRVSALVNARNRRGMSAVMFGCKGGKVDVLRVLVGEMGGCADGKNVDGDTVLHLAAFSGYSAVLRYLFEAVPAVASGVNELNVSGMTPLIVAIRVGSIRCVEALVEWGADLNRCSRCGKSPLVWAVESARRVTALGSDGYDGMGRDGSMMDLGYYSCGEGGGVVTQVYGTEGYGGRRLMPLFDGRPRSMVALLLSYGRCDQAGSGGRRGAGREASIVDRMWDGRTALEIAVDGGKAGVVYDFVTVAAVELDRLVVRSGRTMWGEIDRTWSARGVRELSEWIGRYRRMADERMGAVERGRFRFR